MFRKKNSESSLCKPKEQYGLMILLAFIAACALFVPYIIQNDGYFLYYGDFNVQQIPFYKLAHQAVREGSIFWNFGTDLGANFIGSYSFYLLGSPFFWLTLPFPNDFVPHLMGPLLILKFTCAAVAAYAFISRFVKNKDYAVIGGLLYAFSGYSVYNIFFNHFHEAIILFPLLLLSLEWLMCRERVAPFIFMVAFSAFCNYYFFFGMVIFTVIYFVIRVLSGDWDMFVRPFFIKRDIGRFALLALSAVAGVLISAVMLLPAILAITGNTRIDSYLTGWNGIVYSRSQIYAYIFQCFFFPPDLPARPVFFPDADVKWSSVAGWLPLFGMTGVFAHMAAHRKSWQKKLIITCMVIALVPILNSAFSAFNYSYYARWFYMPVLIMALMTAQGLEDTKVNWVKGWKWSAAITTLFVLVVGFFPAGQYSDGSFSGFGLYTDGYQDRFLVTSAIAVVSLLLLLFLLFIKKKWKSEFTRTALCLVLLVSVVYSSYSVAMGKSSSYSAKDYIIPHMLNGYDTIQLADAKGEVKPAAEIDDVRIDVYKTMDNVAMFFGMSGINAFHSIVPGSVMEFYDYVDVERTVATRPETERYALRGLLSVKYMFDYASDSSKFENAAGGMELPGFSVYAPDSEEGAKEDSLQNGFYVYQNEYFVPYGFTYDYYITEEYMEKFAKQDRVDMMLKGLLLTDEQIETYGHLMADLASTGEDYGEQLNYSSYMNSCLERAATACSEFTTDSRGFTAKTTLKKDNLVFFSIPYDEGWSATVDGVAVPIEKVNVGFMAVPVSGDGNEHTIRFTYDTPGLTVGCVTTFFGLLVAAALVLFVRRYRKTHTVAMEEALYEEELARLEAERLAAQQAEEAARQEELARLAAEAMEPSEEQPQAETDQTKQEELE